MFKELIDDAKENVEDIYFELGLEEVNDDNINKWLTNPKYRKA